MKSTLYLETSVISYLTARPSRDLIVAAHQQITHDWWDKYLKRYEVFISGLVLIESRQGDTDAAQRRLMYIEDFPFLDVTTEVEALAEIYIKNIPLPDKAYRDAIHLAVASLNGMDYLITWNCKHIAHGEVKKGMLRINDQRNIESPIVCTPEELMGGE
jgi:predicted nucleic acid-binding protein